MNHVPYNVVIEVCGGKVVGVSGLPDDWVYEVIYFEEQADDMEVEE